MADELKNISGITPPMFKAYLSRSGWEKQEYERENIAKYAWSEDKSFSVLLPEKISTRDYDEAVSKAMRIISQVEDISFDSVLKGILSPNQDEMKFQFCGAAAKPGSLPLEYLISAAKSIQDSIIYSACAEIQPQPFYNRKLKDAINCSKKVRFGQTGIGSFIVSIEVPFEQPVRHSLGFQDPDPLGRRLVTRLMRGMKKAHDVAVDNEQLDVGSEYKTGINANIAESLASLADEDLGIEVKVGTVWSKSLVKPSDMPDSTILLDRTTFSSLISIGKTMRGPGFEKDVTISGVISRLSRDDVSEDDYEEADASERMIVIRPEFPEDLPTKSVRISLTPEDYSIACDAHRDRKKISIDGRLEKIGKWQISAYKNLKILT